MHRSLLLASLILTGLSVSAAELDPLANAKVELILGWTGEGQTPLGGTLREPFAVDIDRQGNYYVAELSGGRVLRLDAQGKFSVFAGTGAKGYAGDGGPAAAAQFNGMHHLAVTPEGDVLVADTWNCCVRKIDARTGTIRTIVGTGHKGYSGDGGPAAKAQCGGIYSIAIDTPRQRLLLADLDNRRIRVVSLADGTIDTLAGNGQRGVPSDGRPAKDSPLVDPRAVACDDTGTVYILERGGNALRAVDLNGRIRTVAGTGKKGPPADDAPAKQATFNGPKHLCCDRAGDVLVADAENNVVVKYLVKQDRVVRVVGTGKKGSAGVGGPACKAEIIRPHGVLVDSQGSVYVVDSYNNRVLRLQPK